MDLLLRERKFEDAGRIIAAVNPGGLSDIVILAWMTAVNWTKLCKDELPGRDEFLKRCEAEIRRRDPKGADSLLIGLV